MSRTTRRTIVTVLVILALMIGVGALTSGFTVFDPTEIKENLTPARNPDNIIKIANVSLTDVKSSTSDINVKVDDLGVVTLNGTASADDEWVYGQVFLAAGTYTFTGAPDSSAKTYTLTLKVGSTTYRSDSGSITIQTTGTYNIYIAVKENAELHNVKIKPVIVPGTEAGDFYA